MPIITPRQTIIDAGADPALSRSQIELATANGGVYIFETNRDIYVTAVDQTYVSQTSLVNNPGGTSDGEVQIKTGTAFGADPDFRYNTSNDTLLVKNITGNGTATFTGLVNLGSNANVKVTGGSNGQSLVTDGFGNLSWQAAMGSGTVTSVGATGSGLGFSLGTSITDNAAITAAGSIELTVPTSADLRANLTIGTVANANFNANASQVLLGNGAFGTISQLVNGNSSVTVAANSNVSISAAGNIWNFADDGKLTLPGGDAFVDASVDFVGIYPDASKNNGIELYTTATEIFNTGNVNVVANVAGTAKTWIFEDTGDLTAPGNITAVNANLGNAATANFFIGSGANLTSLPGANVSGAVAFATTANAVALANVSGAGNIASINIDGAAGNILYGNGVFAPFALTGDAGNLSNIIGANVSGAVAFATTANAVALANVSGAGNIASINIDGVAGNVLLGNGVFGAVPGLGNVGALNLDGNVANVLRGDGTFGADANSSYGDSNVVSLLGSFGSNTISTTGLITADGGGLSNIAGGNVTGTVSAATTAGTVTTAAQPNITSVGTLTSLAVTGAISANNIGNISAINISGNASQVLRGNGVFTAPPAVGANGLVQFADNGLLAWDTQLSYSTATERLSTGNLTVANVANIGTANIATAALNTVNFNANVTANIATWAIKSVDGDDKITVANSGVGLPNASATFAVVGAANLQGQTTIANLQATVTANADTPSGNLVTITINGVAYQLLAV